MRLSPLFAALGLAFALSPLGCASDPAEDDNIVSPPEEGTEEDELRAMSITEKDDGKTITVVEGQNVLVKLKSNPTTGYKWEVVSTNRSFGYPSATKFFPNSGATGSGGIERFTWKTKGPFPLVGEHTVKMEYKRSWEQTDVAPAKTFSFTVKIVAGECPQLSPPAPGFCKDGQIKPRKNESGCTVGYECEEGCGGSVCGADQSCQYCWGSMQCIPNGAMC